MRRRSHRDGATLGEIAASVHDLAERTTARLELYDAIWEHHVPHERRDLVSLCDRLYARRLSLDSAITDVLDQLYALEEQIEHDQCVPRDLCDCVSELLEEEESDEAAERWIMVVMAAHMWSTRHADGGDARGGRRVRRRIR